MITRICKPDSSGKLSEEFLLEAAKIIKNGGLVAFPTETVYGLGANALDKAAVCKIYEAKGRPSDNPLIAHISSIDMLRNIARDISSDAERLIDRFWPGPLTLIFQKTDRIPLETSGGLDTVAVRFPENETARSFISVCGCPIAAPSANISGSPSPTAAEHVYEDFNGKIDMIIDGGSCEYGLESTIVDCSVKTAVLLRPGSITPEMLGAVCEIKLDKGLLDKPSDDFCPKSPGQKYRHYAPKAELFIVAGEVKKRFEAITRLISENSLKKIGVFASEENASLYKDIIFISSGSNQKPEEAAFALYSALREFDRRGVELVYAEAFEPEGIGLAIMNRLQKAAGYKVIKV